MRRSRITITLRQKTVEQVDLLIDHKQIRNRSHAIEYILDNYLQGKVHKAIILAGGQGTHLRPYTYEVPKPLLPVQGKPLLEHLIEQLKKSEITEIILCIGYLGEKIKDYFGDGSKWGIHIVYLEEKEPLFTGGAVKQAQALVHDAPFLIIHGDILTTLSFQDLIDFHIKEHAVATIALSPTSHPGEYGQFKLQGTKLLDFYQKSDAKDVKSLLVHTGIYVCEPELFQYFPKTSDTFLLEDIITKIIDQKKGNGFMFEGQWFDVGSTENYEKAIKEFKTSPSPDQKSSKLKKQ
ncbi:nucleotidyltransferase family protein [Candidatus Roizmanbacteria bacterium]|nr:nucleotidyltransferase family protein [Candidatus Roizmanbacteria bacterium]